MLPRLCIKESWHFWSSAGLVRFAFG